MSRLPTRVSTVALSLALAIGLARAEDQVTPELWQQHAAPGGFVENWSGHTVDGVSFDGNVASKYRLRWNKYASDQDLYEYLRANMTGLKLGPGKVEAHAYVRGAGDLDGDYRRQFAVNQYYFFRDILDAERNGKQIAVRVYTANAVVDGVIPYTKLTVGRTYAGRLNSVQVDGGELALGTSKYQVYGYTGRPVSFFFDTKGQWVYAGGAEFQVAGETKLRAEYLGTSIQGVRDNTFAARLDQGIKVGTAYLEYRNIDGGNQGEVGGTLASATLGSTLSLKYRQLFDTIGVDPNQAFGFPITPFTTTLGPYSKNGLFQANAYQRVTQYALLGAGFEVRKVNGGTNFDNRDYRKYRASLDLDPTKTTHIQVVGEYWDVDAVTAGITDGRLHGGAQVSQALTKQLQAWAGTSWEQFKFDVNTNQRKEAVRKYYVGGQWSPTKHLNVLLDFDAENSDVFNDLGQPNLVTNYTGLVMLNIVL